MNRNVAQYFRENPHGKTGGDQVDARGHVECGNGEQDEREDEENESYQVSKLQAWILGPKGLDALLHRGVWECGMQLGK